MSSIVKGTPIPFKELPAINLEMLKAYANASGDQNPIHQDESIAKKMGLPGVIAHGMLTSAFIAERALAFMQEESGLKPGWKLSNYQNRFKSMTVLGDVISIGGTVKDFSESSIRLDLQAKNQRGEITTTGSAIFSLS
jgi:acyl dehydratase